MITITIEGKAGEGKTRISNAIRRYCVDIGKVCAFKEDITDAALEKNKEHIDVLIIEKQS